jgi:predicted nucleic acid-binding protein
VNVVDSSGGLEYCRDGRNAAHFAGPLAKADEDRLPMADSVILATARQFNAVLWTQDADLERLPGVRYVAAGRGG